MPPVANLSGAIKAGDRVYLSGMLGHTPETTGDVGAQTKNAARILARSTPRVARLPTWSTALSI